jgi:DNA ligase 1
MKDFARLYATIDETTKTNEKIKAMRDYFDKVPPSDAAWAIYFLSGRKPKQLVQVPKLVAWAIEEAAIPEWMFGESYDAVGDLAETIALLLPDTSESSDLSLTELVEKDLLVLREVDDIQAREIVTTAWRQMDSRQRYVWNKLLTGEFRVGVSQQLVVRAISAFSGISAEVIAHRMMGTWDPNAEFFQRLVSHETDDADISRPYPFSLAYPLQEDPSTLGDSHEWLAEWKWDGIRSQLIRRSGQTFIWSRGEDLITDRFPELAEIAKSLPDGTVIDGEILPWRNGVLPFANLQRRIGRKVLTKKILEEIPVSIVAYDLLEWNAEDIRDKPLSHRRQLLVDLLSSIDTTDRLIISPTVSADSWQSLALAREGSRSNNVEGLMLKHLTSPYRVGRQRGDWWKWKIDPLTIDAVLIYAQRGSGRRASLYTDYTFGVWDQGALVPIAKAYSGLTDKEILEVDSFVRQNTLQKFGPVRVVKPELVFELGFEGIQKSSRHKSGIAVRFPRMLRQRPDKPVQEADTLDNVREILNEYDSHSDNGTAE